MRDVIDDDCVIEKNSFFQLLHRVLSDKRNKVYEDLNWWFILPPSTIVVTFSIYAQCEEI
uniref:Uncharacterized protein n=1 Tax=Anguilla anguilla TaxID=7936 RepID=A0A0E9PZC2_ANGAN